MWKLLTRCGQPSFGRHLQLRALELNQRALRLLSQDAKHACGLDQARELVAVANAADACWRALRGALEDTPDEPGWRTVKAGLQAQARLLSPLAPLADILPAEELPITLADDAWPLPARRRRELQGTLLDQSRWLGVLVERPAPPQAVLEAEVVRVYRKARRDLRKRPYRRRAHQRLRRLIALVELTGAGSGPIQHGRLAALCRAGQRLNRLLLEQRRLTDGNAARQPRARTRTVKRRQRNLARAINHEVARHFAQVPKQFAQRLPWEIFCCLAEQPDRRSGPGPMVDFGGGRRLNADPSEAAGPIGLGAVRFGENAC